MDSIHLIPYIDDARLYDYAVSCAQTLRPDARIDGRTEALALQRRHRETERCYVLLRRRWGDSPEIPAACEWLLDNRYLLQRETPEVLRALSKAGRQRSCRGKLLTLELCRALLQSGNGKLTEARCALFLRGFQSVTVLQRHELLLLPAALRAAVLEAIADACAALLDSTKPEALTKTMEALFTSLRALDDLDSDALLEAADVPGAILSRDPTEDYARMDAVTRDEYRRRLAKLARRRGVEEQVLAEMLVKEAAQEGRHVGFLLFSPPPKRRAALYLAGLGLGTLALLLLLAKDLEGLWAALLLLVPVYTLVKGALDFVLLRLLQPQPLPRLELREGVPPEGKTLCVLSVLLGCCDPSRLEALRLLSRAEGKNLLFGLLADLPAAEAKTKPEDAAQLAAAQKAIEALNRKYGGGFYLFTRERRFDGTCWCGHERKRGALTELAALVCGEASALSVVGDRSALAGTKYLISLDTDTQISPGALGRLIGAAMHPFNRPQCDDAGVVTAGHAIVHPRIETELESSCATDFALIFAGPGGSDPYCGVSGELYMDAFDCGGFAGKGILDAKLLLACAKRLPEGRILSHDALEGAYLRGAYMGDAAFSDAFPAKPLAFFRRQHRWIRGDWQNARWIFAPELAAMDRFRLLDSLLRSLLPPATLAAICLGFFLPSPGLALAALAALTALLRDLLYALLEAGLSRPREGQRLRRHSRLLTGLGGAIVRCFMRLWLLPLEAWVSLSAIITALWRMLITKRRLLQWKTSAQDSGAHGLSDTIRAGWQSVVLGVVLMAFSPQILGKAAGLYWLLSPLAAWALSLPAQRERPLSTRDRELLLSAVSDSFAYFRELCGAEDHALPPDNYQAAPPIGAAHRTSPTNIGLYLACLAALGETGFLPRREAAARIGNAVESLERMEHSAGHLYNWYDTRTLEPLRPKVISTVDSGNLCAGLLCTRSALEGWGAFALADRVDALIRAMDFAMLYDTRRGLFAISYDVERRRRVGGWYDLMASEAMLTSYLAVALGEIPARHWKRLSRAQLQKDGYRGLASWTGTMFEYLMPALFLPLYRGSLLYESARFCLHAQRRRHLPGKPWGCSESAFFSLDAHQCYRYKAHGVPALALKRGMEHDLVISPYSSFLALAVEPTAAARNLRRLRVLGAEGRYGFFEALDYTPGRCAHPDGERVESWMAHHLGMSILAALNALEDGVVRRLFFAAPETAAYCILLQERLPTDGSVVRSAPESIPERPTARTRTEWTQEGDGTQPPCAALLSNGVYALRLTSDGRSAAHWGELCLYRPGQDDPGLSLLLGGLELLPVSDAAHRRFGEERCTWEEHFDGFSAAVMRQCAATTGGELLTLRVTSEAEQTLPLMLAFRPMLAREQDWDSHSAYWQLGMEAALSDGALLLRRLSKRDGKDLWLCITASGEARFSAEAGGGLGPLRSPYVTAELSLPLRRNRPVELRFALCLGFDRESVLREAQALVSAKRAPGGGMLRAAALRLGLSAEETGAAMKLVLPLWENRLRQAAPRRELWRWGVSGDLPILLCEADAAERDWLLRAFCLLKCCGLDSDLVFLSREEGEYLRPRTREIERALAEAGLETLLGSPGGVHIAPAEAAEIFRSRAALIVGEERALPVPLVSPLPQVARSLDTVPPHRAEDGAFVYDPSPALPPRIWQLVLSGGTLGAFAADFGPAGLWLHNAREMRLLPPPDDIRATSGSEALYVLTEQGPVSLFADGRFPCSVRYLPGAAVWEKELDGRRIETRLFLPPEKGLRVLHIRGAEGLPLVWELHPTLGAPDASSLRIRQTGSTVELTNPEAYLPATHLLIHCSVSFAAETDFCPEALRLRMTAGEDLVLLCGTDETEASSALLAPGEAERAMEHTLAFWRGLLGRFRLLEPAGALSDYLSGWAVYQCYVGRVLARSSIYQSGGAVGFRDQLQDCVNLMLIDPALARRQILDCCRHQYAEGDVMHWWHRHPECDRGVRTRCSDDLLWLVWALCEYVEASGDEALCRREAGFLASPPLADDEHDRYERPAPSEEHAPVLEHAARALRLVEERGFGPHGLPRIGSGDWNDGLDRVGGESVWLGWFLSCCALRFAQLLERLGDGRAAALRALSERVGRAADSAFNGRWYLRAWDREGKALGDEPRIDSLAQSWAAFCPWATPERVDAALDAALARLVDREHGLVRLLDPPYGTEDSPGYLSGYGAGFRENGGQYTHAAIWLAMALLRRGRAEEGREILAILLPAAHDAARYGAEPFVLAADVCAAKGHEGEAGWSWYTGSAGWYFRAVTQELLNLTLIGGRLQIRPAALAHWRAVWTDTAGRRHEIVRDGEEIRVDGAPYTGEAIG